MNKIFRRILNAILPPRCKKCGKVIHDDDGLCEDCFREINFISAPYCSKCGIPFAEVPRGRRKLICGNCAKDKHPLFRMSRAAVKYDDVSKPMILALKFMDRTDNAAILAKWMKLAGKDIWAQGVDMIIPIPLHYTRLIKRRYNQAGLLAKELSRLTDIPVDFTSVIRHRKTRPQVEFSGHERVKNVRGAFSVKHPERLKGKRIVLIDDVMTTGSTLKECALALKAAGVKSIDTLTVARVCRI